MSPFVVAYQKIFFYRALAGADGVADGRAPHAVGAFIIGALLFLAFEDRFTEQL